MKTLKMFAVAALAVALLGGIASAGDCHAPAAVKVQQVTVAQPIVVAQAIAVPVYVVPSAPTVAIVQQQVVYAQPVVVQQQQQKVVVQQQKVVQQVVQQKQVTRTFQRSVTR